jgi:toxin YoeB
MAGRVIWSRKAQADRKEILAYWVERNKSNVFSRKLQKLFFYRTHQLLELYQAGFESTGQKTSHKNVQYTLVRHYKVYYEFNKGDVFVLRVWDARRNPENEPF